MTHVMSLEWQSGRRWIRNLGIGLGVMALIICTSISLHHAQRQRSTWPAEADTFYLPPSGSLRIFSLRHTELFADLIHARANVYFGTQISSQSPSQWLASYLHAAVDLDPKFQRLYISGGAMLVYNGQRIVPEMVLAANKLLERGHKAFPLDWEIPFQLGFNYLYELPNSSNQEDPRIPQWRQKGVEYLRQAAYFEDVPYYLPNLVARMLTKQGSDDLALKHLERTYALNSNEKVREQIRNKIFALKGQQATQRLEEEWKAYRHMLKQRYIYAPEAFSIIVGPRLTAPGILAAPSPFDSSHL
jgi:hypothetical protein